MTKRADISPGIISTQKAKWITSRFPVIMGVPKAVRDDVINTMIELGLLKRLDHTRLKITKGFPVSLEGEERLDLWVDHMIACMHIAKKRKLL